eukprot:3540661-Prymnesium_polylepis.1
MNGYQKYHDGVEEAGAPHGGDVGGNQRTDEVVNSEMLMPQVRVPKRIRVDREALQGGKGNPIRRYMQRRDRPGPVRGRTPRTGRGALRSSGGVWS